MGMKTDKHHAMAASLTNTRRFAMCIKPTDEAVPYRPIPQGGPVAMSRDDTLLGLQLQTPKYLGPKGGAVATGAPANSNKHLSGVHREMIREQYRGLMLGRFGELQQSDVVLRPMALLRAPFLVHDCALDYLYLKPPQCR